MIWFILYKNRSTGDEVRVRRNSATYYTNCGTARGTHFQVPQGIAWCDDCASIRMAESYHVELDRYLEIANIALHDDHAIENLIVGGKEHAEFLLEEFHALERCLWARVSKPRCLTCEQTSVTHFPDSAVLQLPDGHVWVRDGTFCDQNENAEVVLLNAEGAKVAD